MTNLKTAGLIAAPVYHALIAAYERGDAVKAADLQALAVRMIDAFLQCGAHPIAAFKWFMSRVAVECGPVRLPLVDPTPEQVAALETQLEASGIFEWVQRRASATGEAGA